MDRRDEPPQDRSRRTQPAALVRILFLVSMILPGPQILAYLALWIIMPKEGRT